ncbi:hypothetical protein BKA58DRAFT_379273 [Alternaria rosae]|uniref:uncharacterized protein n=1 Tax=Alternaria rosae TaxID=1187941 RepID=UPI001E8DA4F5|nr:uncharacterized protein BKA58DRAFT_379273 [Alternaria rosae]KAH6875130.1 hypothetical protein BKA58DRAFT_379273 [Alternaria rosae]
MWNETVVGGRVDVQGVQGQQDPKGGSLKRKRVYLDMDNEVEASNGEGKEEKEIQVEERGRRKRTKTLKASQNEEISMEKTSGTSRSRGNAASGSVSRPASCTAAATAASSHLREKFLSTTRASPPSRPSTRSAGPLVLPTTKHSPSDPIRINPTPAAPSALALEIASRIVDLRSPSSTSSSTASPTPTTPPISPNEGPRAAFHRLFPHLPSFSDYGDIGDWRELMTWTKDKGWYVRGEDDIWAKPVWKKPGWNGRDERLEKLWEGCVRRLEAERGWTWEEREEEGRKRGLRRPVDQGRGGCLAV